MNTPIMNAQEIDEAMSASTPTSQPPPPLAGEARRVVPVDPHGQEIEPRAGGRGAMAGFQGSAADASGFAGQAGSASAVAREEAEMKASIVLARSAQRDELVAYNRIIRSCQRPGFAEGARYSFPRGGARVEGPSVDMAREAARCWGNIRYGLRIVTEDRERVHIKGFAHDLETNTYVETEDKFGKLIQRRTKQGETRWVEPDERDLRELVNRRGAICVRNAILQLMPPDVIEDAMEEVRRTIQRAAAGELARDRQTTLRRLSLAFGDIGVSVEMITAQLGHPIDLIDDMELTELRGIYKSIIDGNSKREDHFAMPTSGAGGAGTTGSSAATSVGEVMAKIMPPAPQPDAAKPSGEKADVAKVEQRREQVRKQAAEITGSSGAARPGQGSLLPDAPSAGKSRRS